MLSKRIRLPNIRYYHKRVVEHFENPSNIGSFDKNEPNVYTSIVGSPACGDVLKLQIKVENDTIVDCKTKIFGCGSAVAASSYATELIKNKKINDIEQITNYDIANHLNLPPVKLHCSMLAEDAIKSAINDYQVKNES